MHRREDRFPSGRERYRFNRPNAPQNSSNDYNNRTSERNKLQSESRSTTDDVNPKSEQTSSSLSSTSQSNNTNNAGNVQEKSASPAKEVQVKTESTGNTDQSQNKSSSEESKKPASSNQVHPQQSDGKKKFTGRCRLFFGNIPLSLTDEEFGALIKPYGETEDLFLNAKKGFGFVKLETRAAAEACKNGLDGTELQGRSLRVRYATHSAALQVKNLSLHCTNEVLEEAFSIFGEVERAVVVVDDRGKSQGTGIVEFSRRSAFSKALDTINNGVFLISKSLRPVCVEPLDQKDEEDGLPEKYALKTQEWLEEMSVAPRVAELGSYEYDIGMKWKELEKIEAEKKAALEDEMTQKRLEMELEVESMIHEHKANMLRQDMMRRQAELNALEAQRRHREELKLKELEMRRMQLNQSKQSQQMNRGSAQMGSSSATRLGGSNEMLGNNMISNRGQGGQGFTNNEQELLMQQQQALRERQQMVFREMQQYKQGSAGANSAGQVRPMIPPPQPPQQYNQGMDVGQNSGRARDTGRMGGGGLLANPDQVNQTSRGYEQRSSRFDQPPSALQGAGSHSTQGMQQRGGAIQLQHQQNRMFVQGGMGSAGDAKRPRRF